MLSVDAPVALLALGAVILGSVIGPAIYWGDVQFDRMRRAPGTATSGVRDGLRRRRRFIHRQLVYLGRTRDGATLPRER